MKILPPVLGLILASALGCSAQVVVEVLLDQEQFLRDESLPVRIRVTNRSGQTLQLGKERDWLTFLIEGRDGFPVSQKGELSVPGELTLDSALSASRTVNLMPYFDLSQPGRYVITATLKIKAWNEEHLSKPKNFDIVRGTKIWEQEFGVPAAGGPPEIRKYALQQANYLKQSAQSPLHEGKELKLYVRVTDSTEAKVFRVLPIGPLVSFSRPEAQVDKTSKLHVLFQTGARSFSYTVTNPDGETTLRQTYDYTQTRPILRSGEEGKVFVAGGIRRAAAGDYSPVSPVSTTNNVKP